MNSKLLTSSYTSLLNVLLLSTTLLLTQQQHTKVNAQGCSNTCPPINFGKPVEALCEGDIIDSFANIEKSYTVCHPTSTSTSGTGNTFKLGDFRGAGKITVIANYYTGCNAGRRESGVFAHVAQRYHNIYGNNNNNNNLINFIQSVKGGGSCTQWADMYQEDAAELYPDSDIIPVDVPLSVNDVNYEIRDDLFTTPFGHPSYVILDQNLQIRNKFIGPCCGYASYYSCTADVAKGLDVTLTEYVDALIDEQDTSNIGDDNSAPLSTPTAAPIMSTPSPTSQECEVVGLWSDWSECSLVCGSEDEKGTAFRWRTVLPLDKVNSGECPSPIETKPCTPIAPCGNTSDGDYSDVCVAEFGATFEVQTVAGGFNSPRDVAFHPTPGLHLGEYSEGREFHRLRPEEEKGTEEAWVVNGGNHSLSIVVNLGSDEHQTTISRRDRGYFHYMINGTALSFNTISNSSRTPDRDAFNYMAICNNNANTYLDTKEPNYFMGPTLYNTVPTDGNTVNRLGGACRPEEPCYFLHSDMLHEAPVCVGITHDPELSTAYGNVYWAFDATGNRNTGQLVRFDFQQPHGPGSMDHSVAAVRRYVEVSLSLPFDDETDEKQSNNIHHAGMVVHPTRREVYIAVPGSNQIKVVNADSGSFARTARDEYPIYSNRLPSFEYSIWECVEQSVFVDVDNIDTPSGMALSADGERLFVAEQHTGKIFVFEIASRSRLFVLETGLDSIGGLAIGPISNTLVFVDAHTNALYKIESTLPCASAASALNDGNTNVNYMSRLNPDFVAMHAQAEDEYGATLSLTKDYQCKASSEIPDASYFDQVHDATGYADVNPDVQSVMTGMDESAALLANRTDCGYNSELNFDALLLGGFYCHSCLPEQDLMCDGGGSDGSSGGGICTNVQWLGYTCDNEFFVVIEMDVMLGGGTTVAITVQQIIQANGTETLTSVVDPSSIVLRRGVTYRFTVLENDANLGLCIMDMEEDAAVSCATKGPLFVSYNDDDGEEDSSLPLEEIVLFVEGNEAVSVTLTVEQAKEDSDEHGGDGGESSSLSIGMIIGIVVGCVTILLSLFVLMMIRRRRNMNMNMEMSGSEKMVDMAPMVVYHAGVASSEGGVVADGVSTSSSDP